MTARTDKPERLRAGLVLCGGKSSRMGRPKADLPMGDETMLARVVRLLSASVSHIVIVASAEQQLPSGLPPQTTIVRDQLLHAGPLAGISVGLSELQALPQHFERAFVTSCDVPFLQPGFVEALFLLSRGHDVAVPVDKQHFHPLAAVYRVELAETVQQLVTQGERRPRHLFDRVKTLRVPTESLRHVDPDLRTLLNLNTPQEYLAALEIDRSPIPRWLATLVKKEEGSH